MLRTPVPGGQVGNAAAFLGLDGDRRNRRRLMGFYEEHDLTKPPWLEATFEE